MKREAVDSSWLAITGLGFSVWGLGFRSLGFRVWGFRSLGFRV